MSSFPCLKAYNGGVRGRGGGGGEEGEGRRGRSGGGGCLESSNLSVRTLWIVHYMNQRRDSQAEKLRIKTNYRFGYYYMWEIVTNMG